MSLPGHLDSEVGKMKKVSQSADVGASSLHRGDS